MKTVSLVLLISGCVLARGIAYASSANPARQESPGQSTITSAGSNHSRDPERTTVSSQSKDGKETIDSDERGGRSHTSSKTRTLTLPTPSKSNRAKKVWQNHEHARSEDVTNMRRQLLTKPAIPGNKAVTIHTLPMRPATVVAIGGQHFGNGRDRSAAPAVIGGTENTMRRVQGINGTEVGRKHLN